MPDWIKPDFEEDPIVESKTKSVAANAMAMIRKEKQLVAEAQAAIADRIPPLSSTQNEPIESVATISVDNALSNNDNTEMIKIKIEHEDVSDAIQQLNVTDDDDISNSYDDLSDLIDKI